MFGGPIDWKSRKQKTVTTSTTEAELLALQHAAKETIGWTHLFRAIGLDLEQPDNVMECDNRQTVRLINMDKPVIKTNIRHIDVSRLWLRQEVQRRNINIIWVDNTKMEADGLTKPLPRAKHQQFLKHLNLHDIEHLVREEDS